VLSVGAVVLERGEDRSAAELLDAADQAMYAAKGRAAR
jgi:GGDEF domain-containing protein